MKLVSHLYRKFCIVPMKMRCHICPKSYQLDHSITRLTIIIKEAHDFLKEFKTEGKQITAKFTLKRKKKLPVWWWTDIALIFISVSINLANDGLHTMTSVDIPSCPFMLFISYYAIEVEKCICTTVHYVLSQPQQGKIPASVKLIYVA